MLKKVDGGLYSSYKSHERDWGPNITSNATSTSGERGEKMTERYGDDGATSLVGTPNLGCS